MFIVYVFSYILQQAKPSLLVQMSEMLVTLGGYACGTVTNGTWNSSLLPPVVGTMARLVILQNNTSFRTCCCWFIVIVTEVDSALTDSPIRPRRPPQTSPAVVGRPCSPV